MGFSENRLNLTSDRILLFSFSLSLSPFKNQKMKKKSPPPVLCEFRKRREAHCLLNREYI